MRSGFAGEKAGIKPDPPPFLLCGLARVVMHDKPFVAPLLIDVGSKRREREGLPVFHLSPTFSKVTTRAIVPLTLITGSSITTDNSAKASKGTAFQLSSTSCHPTATFALVS